MNGILYYSNNCPKCNALLHKIGKTSKRNELHFLCVDSRTNEDGQTYLELKTGEKVLLPVTITKVPALLLLDRGCMVIFGDAIHTHLFPEPLPTKAAVAAIEEPESFSFGGGSYHGVASDSFSFWDQSAADMEAKGNGGLRQPHHYVNLDSKDCIETPPDTWTPNKVNEEDTQRYEETRATAINQRKSV